MKSLEKDVKVKCIAVDRSTMTALPLASSPSRSSDSRQRLTEMIEVDYRRENGTGAGPAQHFEYLGRKGETGNRVIGFELMRVETGFL